MRTLLLLMMLPSFACARQTLVVGVDSFPPCIEFGKDGKVSGFDADVLEEVAREVGFDYRFVPVSKFSEVFDGLRSGRFDLAMSGITITEKREEDIDLSHSYLDSGLRILVRTDEASNTSRFVVTVAVKVLGAVSLLLLAVLFFAHLVWWLEKGDDCFDVNYPKGILQACYWAVVTMSTVGYGDYAPKHPVGRICAIFVIFIGVGIFGFEVAQMTSVMTADRIAGMVIHPEDLRGKDVGVPEGTTSVETMAAFDVNLREYPGFDEACDALEAGKLYAVVFDSPAVLNRTLKDDDVKAVGEMFAPQKYGIAMRDGSPLREPINRAILRLVESDRYEYLQTKWFGKAQN